MGNGLKAESSWFLAADGGPSRQGLWPVPPQAARHTPPHRTSVDRQATALAGARQPPDEAVRHGTMGRRPTLDAVMGGQPAAGCHLDGSRAAKYRLGYRACVPSGTPNS